MKKRKNKKINKILTRIGVSLVTFLFIAIIGLGGVIYILEFGPSKSARNLFVNSAMESSMGGIVVRLFMSDKEIAEIRKMNSVEETKEVTDTSLVTSDTSTLTEEEKKQIEVINVRGDTYNGKLMIVREPSRVSVGISGKFGDEYKGRTVAQIAESYNAIAATNAGGFKDEGGVGNGGTPNSLVIAGGEIKWGSAGTSYEIIGLDNANCLVVGRMTAKEAINRGVRDAVSFGPILIVNGEAVVVNGSGSGLNPRTAIGQREDGSILLLVLDGRQVNSLGASYADIIDIMLEYGAVNAANLDGGSSSLMYYEGKYINSCASLYGPRDLPTAIIVK